jgi:predicted AlkP superfamily phosphohydrolase/phosphomutase/tetratricopeptide (TPR) repeat protein
MTKRKLLLIGWDAADWMIMKPLMEKGHMPCLSQLVERGVMGNLATLKPVLSPMLWNSIATGKRPDKHGILGFTELNPHTGLVSPSLSTSRKVKALWNIVSQEGGRAHVVNWFASYPAEKISGVCVSETYSTPPKQMEGDWPLSVDAIHPQSLFETLKKLRLHPLELDGDTLQMFCPKIDQVDQTKDRRVLALAKQIAEAINVHTAATWILDNEDWDFMGVYFGAIDHFCHLFMHFHPPRRPDVSEKDFEIFKDAINNCYRFHDVMLARYLELAGNDSVIILCSDHGFRSDHLRPPHTPAIPCGPAVWHRDQGMIVMAGPGIKQDELVHGATLLDIAPTALALMGFPVARDMDGRVLSETFDEASRIGFIDSWESRSGEYPDGMHPPDLRMPVEESQAILDQFVALGYIDPPDEDTDRAAVNANREAKWNLATSFIDAGQVDQAVPLLAELVDDAPDRKDFVMTLANCLLGVGMHEEARGLMVAAMKHNVDPIAVHHTLAEIALASGNPTEAMVHLDQLPHLTNDNPEDFAEFYDVGRFMTLGGTMLKLRDWNKALECFNNVLKLDPDNVRALHGAARALLKTKRYDQALETALRSVELEYRSFLGHYLLGIAFTRHRNWKRAEEAFLVVLRLRPNHINAYRMLAIVYQHLDGTRLSRQDCLDEVNRIQVQFDKNKSNPNDELVAFKRKLQPLISKLEQHYDRKASEDAKAAAKAASEAKDHEQIAAAALPEKAAEASSDIPAASSKEFLIVSGLPRSGTSLMMQMLQASGIPVMTDNERQPDIDNPRGYLEWEAIKKLKTNPRIIEQAEGRVIKVISMLLPHLPRIHDYKVIFMMRPVEEVVASQQKMIRRLETKGSGIDEQDLIKNLTRHRQTILNELKKMPVRVYLLSYENLVERTANVISSLQEFLGDEIRLDPEAMQRQVRPELWRNRVQSAKSI